MPTGKRISELTELTQLENEDVFAVVDDSETDLAVKTKKVSWGRISENKIESKSGNYQLLNSDDVILANAAADNIMIELTSASATKGKIFRIKKMDTSLNEVIIAPQASETVDGQADFRLGSYLESVTVISDGFNWFII